ncbi:MAG: DUF4157 domain-containing protein [Bacteroidia bacterium]|nr:DUF4157 domain-containing protein [Bacteroidia bacterium]
MHSSSQVSKLAQMQARANQFTARNQPLIQRKENSPSKPNQTGLPDQLKSGVENLSGISLDDVQVHYNSDKPAQLNAHAYAQGTDIHLASGQEKHLPHEAWHVVQQKQGRVKPTLQMRDKVPVNDDQGLEREADVMGGLAMSEAPAREKEKRKIPIQARVAQRQLDGLDEYHDPKKIPNHWVEAYFNDITSHESFLSMDEVLIIYNKVRGTNKKPDEEGITINHVNGNHWTLSYKGVDYLIAADGSCGIHTVHLANELLNGNNKINPQIPYFAPNEFVSNTRQYLKNVLTHKDNLEDSATEVRKLIALAIQNSEMIITTGFGPRLQELLRTTQILNSDENLEKYLDNIYSTFYNGLKNHTKGNFIKPSLTNNFIKAVVSKKDKKSLQQLTTDLLKKITDDSITTRGLNVKALYGGKIESLTPSSIKKFMSPKEVETLMKNIPSKLNTKKNLARKKLKQKHFLNEKKRKSLTIKLKSTKIRAKLLNASKLAVLKFNKGKLGSFSKLILKGEKKFVKQILSSEQFFEALHAHKENKKSKKDLQVGSGGKFYTSIGSGGMQVKGLGTYSEEIDWLNNKLKEWKLKATDLFQLLQNQDVDQLKELTQANDKDLKHLLSFNLLQWQEIFRAGPFALGQSAHYKLAFHGKRGISDYMMNMPMYEKNATTNVSETQDHNNPKFKELWDKQTKSTFDGLIELVNLEINDEEIYDENTLEFINCLDEELEDENETPSEKLIQMSGKFMMAPNPFLNSNKQKMDVDDKEEEKVIKKQKMSIDKKENSEDDINDEEEEFDEDIN